MDERPSSDEVMRSVSVRECTARGEDSAVVWCGGIGLAVCREHASSAWRERSGAAFDSLTFEPQRREHVQCTAHSAQRTARHTTLTCAELTAALSHTLDSASLVTAVTQQQLRVDGSIAHSLSPPAGCAAWTVVCATPRCSQRGRC